MNTKVLILFFWAFSLLGAFALKANAQEEAPRIADETYLTYNKTGAIIECNSQTVFYKIFSTHSQLFQKFTCKWIHGNGPSYKRYTIYLSAGDATIIKQWAKTNL